MVSGRTSGGDLISTNVGTVTGHAKNVDSQYDPWHNGLWPLSQTLPVATITLTTVVSTALTTVVSTEGFCVSNVKWEDLFLSDPV